MYRGSSIAVVVPAYQEAERIERVLLAIPSYVDHVVVVDDGSTDATSSVARAVDDPRVELHRHATNRGVGAALRTGYRLAFAAGADIAVVMAGDAQMDPADLPRLLDATPLDGYAKGDRLSWPDARAAMPWTRWLGNHVLAGLTRIATGVDVRDSQCGYTALTRQAAERIDVSRMWPGYGYPNVLLAELAGAGVPIREVPVRPIYADEQSGIRAQHALVVIPGLLARIALQRAIR